MMSPRLQNKIALITGAGDGMGKACAMAYAAAGAAVLLVDLNEQAIQNVAGQILETGTEALPLVADVSNPGDVQRSVQAGINRFARIDILVNNAGHQGPGAPVWEVEMDAWRRTVDVNLWGTFLFCREVIPFMIDQRSGKVINVASGAGVHPMPFFSAYAASKAAVIHFTRTIAEELKPYGINVNAMGVRGITRMWQDVLEAGPGGGSTTESIRAQYQAGMRPEVAENMPVFLFLASEESDRITGQYIEANSLPAYLIASSE
jgi:3-oxoacyl-[acyl-carrier protein] reductase